MRETPRLTRSIQEVDFELQSAKDAFSRVEILHSGPVSLAKTLAE